MSRAQAAIDDLAAQDFAAIQRDNEYLFSLSFLADAVETLGDDDRAHQLLAAATSEYERLGMTRGDLRAAPVLYGLLAPYEHLNAIGAFAGRGSVKGARARSLARRVAVPACPWHEVGRRAHPRGRGGAQDGVLRMQPS